jgi:hypothetical protein
MVENLGIQGNSNITIILNDNANIKVDFILSISNMDINTDLLLFLYEQIYHAPRIFILNKLRNLKGAYSPLYII